MAEDATSGGLETRRKRLRYRAWHRGTREMDMLLGRFADAHIATCGVEMLDRFEKLMDEEDSDLQKWLMRQERVPDHVDAGLVEELTEFQIDFTTRQ